MSDRDLPDSPVFQPDTVRFPSLLPDEDSDEGYCVRHDQQMEQVDPVMHHDGGLYTTADGFSMYVCRDCMAEIELDAANEGGELGDGIKWVQQAMRRYFKTWDGGDAPGDWFQFIGEGTMEDTDWGKRTLFKQGESVNDGHDDLQDVYEPDQFDDDDYLSFEEAGEMVESGEADGIGFMLTRQDPFLVIEVTNAFNDDGEVVGHIQSIIETLGDGWFDVDPDGVLRMWYTGSIPVGYDSPVSAKLSGGPNKFNILRVLDRGFIPVFGKALEGYEAEPDGNHQINIEDLLRLFKICDIPEIGFNPMAAVHEQIAEYHRERGELDTVKMLHHDEFYPAPKDHAVYVLQCENQLSTKEFLKAGEGVYGDSDDIPSWAWAANHAEECIYVGYSSDPYERISDHLTEPKKGANCTRLFPPTSVRQIDWYDDAIEAAEAEEAIADELDEKYPEAFVWKPNP